MVFASGLLDLPGPQVVGLDPCLLFFLDLKHTLSSYFDTPLHSFDLNEIVVASLYAGWFSNLK